MENKKIKRLYVIGPITGIENDNIDEFERVRDALADGLSRVGITIPHDVVRGDFSWQRCMMRSIHNLTRLRAEYDKRNKAQYVPFYDGIAMLDGWENSKGARIEHDLAEALSIPCKPYREWLEPLQ